MMGLTVNDHKTVPWRRAKYEAHLDEADALRQEIADEAELDLTEFDMDKYDLVVTTPPDKNDVDVLASAGVLERWESVAGRRGLVPDRRKAEHRAVLELLPAALATLGTKPGARSWILATCMRLLRYEQTATPAVGRYLIGQNDQGPVLDALRPAVAQPGVRQRMADLVAPAARCPPARFRHRPRLGAAAALGSQRFEHRGAHSRAWGARRDDAGPAPADRARRAAWHLRPE